MKTFSIGKMHIKTLVDQALQDGTFEVFEFVIDQSDVGPNLHLHRKMDEIIYVVSGSLEATVDGDTKILNAGDRIVLPRNISHIWKTLSPLKMIVIFSPSNRQVEFFTKLEQSIKNKVSWDETILELAKQFDVVPL